MAKFGRQPIEIDLKQVEAYASRGLSQAQIADALGIGERTIRRRKAGDETFLAAFKKGKAKGIAVATSKLFELVQAGNLGAICFFLKCQGGPDWKEKIVQDVQVATEVKEVRFVVAKQPKAKDKDKT